MIALTGASGFLGQSLLEQYAGEGPFICLTRKPVPGQGRPGFPACGCIPGEQPVKPQTGGEMPKKKPFQCLTCADMLQRRQPMGISDEDALRKQHAECLVYEEAPRNARPECPRGRDVLREDPSNDPAGRDAAWDRRSQSSDCGNTPQRNCPVCRRQTGCAAEGRECTNHLSCPASVCRRQTGCAAEEGECANRLSCPVSVCWRQTGCAAEGCGCANRLSCPASVCWRQTGCAAEERECTNHLSCPASVCRRQTGCTAKECECANFCSCPASVCRRQTSCAAEERECANFCSCPVSVCRRQTGCAAEERECANFCSCPVSVCRRQTGCAAEERECANRFTYPASVCWRQTDYTVESLMRALDGCEGVIHLAARKVEPQAEQTPETYRENTEITENLLEACRRKHIRNVVLLSSRCVYSMRDERPFRENRACHPLNFYGLSKLCMEQMGAYYRDHHDMAVKCLRLAQVFGAGDLLSSAPGVFLRRAMNGEPLMLYGTGAGKRNYLYVKDAVRAIMTAFYKTNCSGVYNIGAVRSVSYRELAQTAKSVAHSGSAVVYLSDRPDDALTVELDISKASRELGFLASYDLKSALQDMKDCLGKRGEG